MSLGGRAYRNAPPMQPLISLPKRSRLTLEASACWTCEIARSGTNDISGVRSIILFALENAQGTPPQLHLSAPQGSGRVPRELILPQLPQAQQMAMAPRPSPHEWKYSYSCLTVLQGGYTRKRLCSCLCKLAICTHRSLLLCLPFIERISAVQFCPSH